MFPSERKNGRLMEECNIFPWQYAPVAIGCQGYEELCIVLIFNYLM